MQQEYDVDAGSATYGRKLDLQCRAEEHELNNSEFKVDGASEQQVEVQYRKNLRVNQAMMLYLKEQIGMPLEDSNVLALDVHGKRHDELGNTPFIIYFIFASSISTKWLSCLRNRSVGGLIRAEVQWRSVHFGPRH